MGHGPLFVVTFGAIATLASVVAARGAWKAKTGQGKRWPLLMFWSTVAGYMFFFTLLRLAYWAEIDALVPIFYLQTLCGAATVISLSYIMVGIIIGPRAARIAMEASGAAAVMIVTLIFALGLTEAVGSPWGVELLPSSEVARIGIAIVYVAFPVLLAALAVYVASMKWNGLHDRRLIAFSASVSLMYVPNAIKYVVLVSGASGIALAIIMAGGAVIGAWAYRDT